MGHYPLFSIVPMEAVDSIGGLGLAVLPADHPNRLFTGKSALLAPMDGQTRSLQTPQPDLGFTPLITL
jgi:hypothetical protein